MQPLQTPKLCSSIVKMLKKEMGVLEGIGCTNRVHYQAFSHWGEAFPTYMNSHPISDEIPHSLISKNPEWKI